MILLPKLIIDVYNIKCCWNLSKSIIVRLRSNWWFSNRPVHKSILSLTRKFRTLRTLKRDQNEVFSIFFGITSIICQGTPHRIHSISSFSSPSFASSKKSRPSSKTRELRLNIHHFPQASWNGQWVNLKSFMLIHLSALYLLYWHGHISLEIFWYP